MPYPNADRQSYELMYRVGLATLKIILDWAKAKSKEGYTYMYSTPRCIVMCLTDYCIHDAIHGYGLLSPPCLRATLVERALNGR